VQKSDFMPKPRAMFRSKLNDAVQRKADAKTELAKIKSRQAIGTARVNEVERRIAFGLPVSKSERGNAGSEAFGAKLEERMHLPHLFSTSRELVHERELRKRGVKGLVRHSAAFARTLRSSKDLSTLERNQRRVLEASELGFLGAKRQESKADLTRGILKGTRENAQKVIMEINDPNRTSRINSKDYKRLRAAYQRLQARN
jgi:hypothetical protein